MQKNMTIEIIGRKITHTEGAADLAEDDVFVSLDVTTDEHGNVNIADLRRFARQLHAVACGVDDGLDSVEATEGL
jgi:hypothetical protein